MPKKRKPAETFDEHVGDVIERAMNDARMTQHELADAVGMARSLMGRGIRGTRPFTVKEFERVAGVLDVPAAGMLTAALDRFGGMEKLLAESAVSDAEGSVDPIDNVSYIGKVKAPTRAAADDNPRTGPKD